MATDLSDVVKQGYMRCKSRSLGLWQKRWIILRRTSQKGPCRLEKYVNENAARYLDQHKVQLLTNVISIDRLTSKKHSFQIEFNDGSSKYFCCDSDLEADNWVKLTIQECFLPASGIANGEPDVLKPGIQKELQEQFKVYLMPNSKLDAYGECLLQVTHENIYLWDIVNSKIKLCAWPLTALRRYGSDLTKFTFEAGRHCATGEGMFIFHTLQGEKIYRKVHQATLAIAEAHQKMKKQQQISSSASASSTNTTASLLNKESSNYSSDHQDYQHFLNDENDQQQQQSIKYDSSTINQHEDQQEQQQRRTSWYNSDNESTESSSLMNSHHHHHHHHPYHHHNNNQTYNHHPHHHQYHHHNLAMGLEV